MPMQRYTEPRRGCNISSHLISLGVLFIWITRLPTAAGSLCTRPPHAPLIMWTCQTVFSAGMRMTIPQGFLTIIKASRLGYYKQIDRRLYVQCIQWLLFKTLLPGCWSHLSPPTKKCLGQQCDMVIPLESLSQHLPTESSATCLKALGGSTSDIKPYNTTAPSTSHSH